MIKIEVYGEDPATIRRQMLELLNIEPNNTVAIKIESGAKGTPADAEKAVAAVKTEVAKAKPAAAAAKPASKPENTPAAAVQPEAPPWVDPNAVGPGDEPAGQQVELNTPAPVTASELREALGEVSEKKGRDALSKLLEKFNVKQFSKLEPSQYNEAMAEAKKVLA